MYLINIAANARWKKIIKKCADEIQRKQFFNTNPDTMDGEDKFPLEGAEKIADEIKYNGKNKKFASRPFDILIDNGEIESIKKKDYEKKTKPYP